MKLLKYLTLQNAGEYGYPFHHFDYRSPLSTTQFFTLTSLHPLYYKCLKATQTNMKSFKTGSRRKLSDDTRNGFTTDVVLKSSWVRLPGIT